MQQEGSFLQSGQLDRCHPIYQLIEIADEVQLMQLHPNVRDLVEKHCVLS